MGAPYFEPRLVSIRSLHLDERWVQDRLAEDPKRLGLGDLVLRDRERPQVGAGRLDLLLQDPESDRRYEVEIQLGRTDETHIIRTLEYWDIERKRYPQYEHCAVIVAEEITSRFLNVIGLFNGYIPLIALKMQAIDNNGAVGLIFTKVLDEVQLGLTDEDESIQEAVDRSYWEEQGSSQTVQIADQLLDLIHEFAPAYELKFNRHYIGLAQDGRPNNFVSFRPQRSNLRLNVKLPRSDETSRLVEEAGMEVLAYDRGAYRIRVAVEDVRRHREFFLGLMKQAFDERI